jgi:hypothetical protein
MKLNRGEDPIETIARLSTSLRMMTERGDILANRLARIRDIASVTRYCAGGPCTDNHLAEIRAVLFDEEPTEGDVPPPFGNDFECCASGRCEVCTPGYDWSRDG